MEQGKGDPDIQVTKALLKGKKNRKARMAEMARERAVLFPPPPPLQDIIDVLNIVTEQGPPVAVDVPIGYAKDGPGLVASLHSPHSSTDWQIRLCTCCFAGLAECVQRPSGGTISMDA